MNGERVGMEWKDLCQMTYSVANRHINISSMKLSFQMLRIYLNIVNVIL